MKHALIKSLNILLVELPKGATNVEINKPRQVTPYFGINWDMPSDPGFKESQGFALFYKDFGGKKNYPKDIEYIAPFEAMSEDEFEKLVESETFYHYDASEFTKYKDYVEFLKVGEHDWAYCLLSARESFLSAVEASNFYFQNPYKKPNINDFEQERESVYGVGTPIPLTMSPFLSAMQQWEQSQSRTFDSALTHIFKIEK